MAMGDEKYILFTTFRRNGTPVATPVWITKVLGTLGGIVKRKRIPYGDRGVIVTPAS